VRYPPLTRRRFLGLGAAGAGAVVLGACAADDDISGSTTTAPEDAGYALFQFVGGGPVFAAGVENRLPFGIGDQVALLPLDRTPERLDVQLFGPDDAEVGAPIDVSRHAEGLPRPYFPLRFTVDAPGTYTARADVEGTVAEMAFEVHSPADVTLIGPGDPMPPLQTPTKSDARGVKPICTREQICPLHDRTVADVRAAGMPTALLVATPAFCQVAICGPVLDLLLERTDRYADQIGFVHAEVYSDPATSIEGDDAYAPVVTDLGLFFEPVLLLADVAGNVVERVDAIYDIGELDAALGRLVGG
jgi:hypothetical protein